MKPAEIIEIIESMAPLSLQESWDVSGVQVASFTQKVCRVGVMLNPVPSSLREAAEAGVDFVVAHHPLSMKPRFPNEADAYLSVLELLLGRGIWLYSAHTSLDAAFPGPASWLARELGLVRVEVLESAGGCLECQGQGIGFVGDMSEGVPYGEFCRKLAGALGKDAWQACGPVPSTVRRVACCPGSGSSLMEAARRKGADVFITGDVKFHAALEADIRVLDVGHFCLEEEMMRRFAELLREKLPLPVAFFAESDPLETENSASA